MPRVHVAPGRGASDVDLAASFAAAYDLDPDPWQRLVLNDWLMMHGGKWSSLTAALSLSRQNGKNALMEIRELYGMVALGERFLHSAHQVKTAQAHFRRLKYFFGDRADDPYARFPELNALVQTVRSVNGQEAIFLRNGGSVELIARSKSSGRGFTVDVLVMDEAQELSEDALEALMPTTAAAPSGNPQWIFAGTPPGPSADGAVFGRIRADALSGRAVRLAYHEWSVEGRDVDLDDRVLWRMTNPALDAGRLQESVIEGERARFSDEGFARERLGRWDAGTAGSQVFRRTQWDVLKADCPDDTVASYGVKFTSDGSGVALAAAYRHESGVHVEPIRQANMGEGTQWLVDELVARADNAAQIVIDGKSGAGFLVNALRDAGVKNKRMVLLPSLDQYVTAHQMFEQAVLDGSLSHAGKAAFDEQVLSVQRRKIGSSGGFGWSAPLGETVVSVDAVTLAFWGARVSKRKPGKRLRVSA